MSRIRRLYRGQNDFDFPRLWKRVALFSLVLVLISIGSLLVRGLNLSIDFVGGAVWEVPTEEMTTDEALDVLGDFDKQAGAKVQEVEDPNGNRIVRIQADSDDIEESSQIASAYAEAAGVSTDDVSTNTVGPSWGEEITKQAGKSLLVFLVLVGAYITFTLEWRMAIAALTAVLHDVLLTVGVYSVFQFQVTPATVISFLTILGYSLYDTIVVYDRVRENTARYDRSSQYTYTAVMRRSLNQVFMRSTNTTVSTLMPVISMLVLGSFVFGQPVLRDFSLALLIGLAFGSYSSFFIAAPFTTWLKEKESKYARIRQRATERGILDVAGHVPLSSALLATKAATAGTKTTEQESKAAMYERPVPPRPRKGKRS
jgi:preprotein translocase subunit SecF